MLQTTNPMIKHKAGLLNLAEELGNVAKASKIMGFSRDTFYRYQELAQERGVDNGAANGQIYPYILNILSMCDGPFIQPMPWKQYIGSSAN